MKIGIFTTFIDYTIFICLSIFISLLSKVKQADNLGRLD